MLPTGTFASREGGQRLLSRLVFVERSVER